MDDKLTSDLVNNIQFDTGKFHKISLDPIWQSSFVNFKPYNEKGSRVQIGERVAVILDVYPPIYMDEVERVSVQFEDDHSQAIFPIRGIRIGSDWIR